MISGIGTDIVKIDRIGRLITRFGDRFRCRICTAAECAAGAKRYEKSGGRNEPRFFAMRFAAKEAAWKALSPPRSLGIGWHDFEVVQDASGKPSLILHGSAHSFFVAQFAAEPISHLSLSDDDGLALAFVVLSTP